MVKIRVEKLCKRFGNRCIFNDFSIEIESGSFTVILGPPGAGKTTLLRLLAGVEVPDGGRIYFDDKDVTDVPAKDRNVAMVFQSYALHPNKKIFDIIASPLKINKVPQEKIKCKVEEVANMLGIGELLNRYPRELSGGQQQRVAIARALVKEANLILFDEPLTNLDYKIREGMRSELKKILSLKGGTIVYATPDPTEALSMAKYVAILNQGKLEQYGAVDDVYNHPTNKFVGYYFSFPPMNLLEGRVIKENGILMFYSHGLKVNLNDYRSKVEEGEELILGIRPSKLLIETANRLVKFEGEVIITEVIGSETIIHIKYNELRLAVLVPKIYRLLPGDKLTIGFDPDDTFIFRKSDGFLIKR
ncbi:MAG: ABC transporter ATP-binding protein [Nitrososphaeria archaeon]